jgi:hypothetical protein
MKIVPEADNYVARIVKRPKHLLEYSETGAKV